ncbi:ferredoxin [Lactococcus ileimucosae]|uniref:Ferredoxin n=1 Tax=Lactococcus ileimucosae TaxID=2941329 RepID=A0ABV4D356_9LACT|nr:ferredoxin [Lactococcus ileimucosae]
MKINIIPENCIACGLCYLHAPDVFDYHDNGIVKLNNSDKLEEKYIFDDKIISAAKACPTAAIKIIKS